MTNQYSHIQFFRRVPLNLLDNYFKAKKIELGINFFELGKKPEDKIFNALLLLPENILKDVETEFMDVNALACEGGVSALIDEASFFDDDEFVKLVTELDGFHAKVMWTFLEKKAYWRGASMFLHADNVSASFWRKRNDLPKIQPCVEDEDINLLAKKISEYFHTKQGRGRNCKVEPYRRGDKEYFFAYPEDFGQSGVEWVRDNLQTMARHPAFEIIFVYCEKEGALDIYAPRNTKAVNDLQKIFAQTILKLSVLPDGKIDNQVYDLSVLDDSKFDFKLEPTLGIESVKVIRLRLTLKADKKKRIVLEANGNTGTNPVYELLSELNLPEYHITQTGIKVTFEQIGNKRAKIRSFNITYPNSCALSYDGNDGKIREMLVTSGIEPKALD